MARSRLILPGCANGQEFAAVARAVLAINQAIQANQKSVVVGCNCTTTYFLGFLHNAGFIADCSLLSMKSLSGGRYVQGASVLFHDNIKSPNFRAIQLLVPDIGFDYYTGKGFAKKQAMYCGVDFIF